MANIFWQKVDEIFPQVADLPDAAERETRLRELCGTDEVLYREISAMLAVDEKAERFIETPIALPDSLSQRFSSTAQTVNLPTLGLAGRQIGAYRVVKKLGAGGMGAVYLAERADGEFYKQVAIKVVKSGANTAFNLRRFRRERQILAALEHPFIARLIDGGTTGDDSPYLVMEYVEGEPLFDFCKRRNLDLRGRLDLFRQICEALAYAHEKGVVHRDIKPGNILVAGNGKIKLLDFGIAKILDPDSIHGTDAATEPFFRQMTPEYASPEQICGEEITAATDVYSLGVVLYELVTGERPYKFPSRAPHEIARVVCEQEVRTPKLETGDPLSDDLKFVVLKSLRKKTSERYSSITDFDRDVSRFLEGLPISTKNEPTEKILASRESKTTADFVAQPTDDLRQPRASKIKWAAAMMATVVLSFLLYNYFTGSPTIKIVKLPHQQHQPHSVADSPKNGAVKNALSGDQVANELYQAGKQQLATRNADDTKKAIEFFDEAAKRDPNFAAAFSGLADAHILLAGQQKDSSASYRKAEEYAVKALALDPDLAEARVSLGMAKFRNTGDAAAAEKHFQRAIEINPQLATAHHWYSIIFSESKNFEGALREARIAAELDPRSAVIQTNLAGLYRYAKRYDEAIFHFDRAIENDNSFVTAYYWKSAVEQFQGKYDEAIDTYRNVRIYSGGGENEPLWVLMHAQAHAAGGRRDEALAVLNRFLQSAEYRKNPPALACEVALVYHLLGEREKTFEWFGKVKVNDAKHAKLLYEDQRFGDLQADPRYVALTEKWTRDGNAKSKKS